jgi:hypothetical protein
VKAGAGLSVGDIGGSASPRAAIVTAVDRDLKLNSIDRYTKSSPRFLLEEHSHCEVPAGCGGAVLRWRDPRHEVPVLMKIAVLGGKSQGVLIDGTRPRTSRDLYAPGQHEVMIDLTAADDTTAQLLFLARSQDADDAPLLLVTGTGTWQWTDLDDSSAPWLDLVPGTLDVEQEQQWAVRRLRESGAEPLTTPTRVARLRVRTAFDLPAGA